MGIPAVRNPSPATASVAHAIPANNPASGTPAASAFFIASSRFRPFASTFIRTSLSFCGPHSTTPRPPPASPHSPFWACTRNASRSGWSGS